MARNKYFLSWDKGRDRKRIPSVNNRALIRLGIILGILLASVLIVQLIVLGHNVRADDVAGGGGSDSNSGVFEPVAKATHGVYAFVMQDLIPGNGFPGMPGLSRFTWNFCRRLWPRLPAAVLCRIHHRRDCGVQGRASGRVRPNQSLH